MYKKKLEEHIRCPLEYGLNLFAGKWKPRIMCSLAKYDELRFSELKYVLVDVSDAALSLALNELQEQDIVYRIQFEEIPPKVIYALTDKGQSAIPVLKSICNWSEQYYYMSEEEKETYDQCLNRD